MMIGQPVRVNDNLCTLLAQMEHMEETQVGVRITAKTLGNQVVEDVGLEPTTL